MKPADKAYIGHVEYLNGGTELSVSVVEKERKEYPLPLRLDLSNHSPTGFSWGYAGSGPAQLSLAILADLLADDARALRIYQDFKFKVVSRLVQDRPFALYGDALMATVEELEQKRRAAGTLRPLPCSRCDGLGFIATRLPDLDGDDGEDAECPDCKGEGDRPGEP